jgi:NADH:ubiquinone oxidoreductase subunit F (NADH-binding)
MVIAAVVTGARHGIVYIRHEYAPERASLERAITEAKADGVLGPRVLGSSHAFDLEIFTSPGGYICGEETALMEAIEGKRAQPRLKGLPPALKGLWQLPTVINNVETFTHVPAILVEGAEWYKRQGVNNGVGWKFVGVSGHVERPGVYEIPMGTPLRRVIDDHAGGMLGGRRLKAFVPSGASSGVLPASLADVPLEWDALAAQGTMMGSSAIVILAEGTCMVDVALNVARFFARESCGKCWPCRVGSEKIVDLLDAVTRGAAPAHAFAPLDDLTQTLVLTSICGLGMVVPSPIASVRRHFPDEVRAHLEERRCPEGVCPMA